MKTRVRLTIKDMEVLFLSLDICESDYSKNEPLMPYQVKTLNAISLLRKKLAIAAILILPACTTVKYRGYELPPALSETFRGGQLKGLEDHTSQAELGLPNPYDQISRVCVSQPIYDYNGNYLRTTVKCW